MSNIIGINVPLSIDIDQLRKQTLVVIRAAGRQILTNDDISHLDGVIILLDDILEHAKHSDSLRSDYYGR